MKTVYTRDSAALKLSGTQTSAAALFRKGNILLRLIVERRPQITFEVQKQ